MALYARRIKYYFDRTVSRGVGSLIVWLLAFALVFSTIVWLLFLAVDFALFGQIAFYSLVHAVVTPFFGPAWDGADTWSFRFFSVVVGFFGIFVTSVLIGLLTQVIKDQVEALRRGKSPVLETGHSIVMGWNQSGIAVLKELIEARRSEGDACILVFAPGDKVEIEDEIRRTLPPQKDVRIVVRTGLPSDVDMPEITALSSSKSVMILPTRDRAGDIETVKSLLGITNNPNRRPGAGTTLVAAADRPESVPLFKAAGGEELVLVPMYDFVSQLIVNTLTQPGLPAVYSELLGFHGNELYIVDAGELAGLTFREAVMRFRDEVLVGILPGNAAGAPDRASLNPPHDLIVKPDDRLVVLALDDSAIAPEPAPGTIATAAIRTRPAEVIPPQHVLLLNANQRLKPILASALRELPDGSSITVLAERAPGLDDLPDPGDGRVGLVTIEGDPADRAVLSARFPAGFTDVIILADAEHYGDRESDDRNIVTLLGLRSILAEDPREDMSIITELLDVTNRRLVDRFQDDDFIVSEDLTTAILAQVSENPEIVGITAELLDPAFGNLELHPASRFLATGEPVDFYTVTEATLRQGAIAIGYRTSGARTGTGRPEIVLNPDKTVKRAYRTDDMVIVVR